MSQHKLLAGSTGGLALLVWSGYTPCVPATSLQRTTRLILQAARSPIMSVHNCIRATDCILPGNSQDEDRWQAVIAIGEYIESDPEPVSDGVHRWGKHPLEDFRTAIATVLLEHLLEHHFDLIFRVSKRAFVLIRCLPIHSAGAGSSVSAKAQRIRSEVTICDNPAVTWPSRLLQLVFEDSIYGVVDRICRSSVCQDLLSASNATSMPFLLH